jgi:hypothetical protein
MLEVKADIALPLPIRYPPILRLPFEITVLIFKHCGSGIKHRLRLSHTCRHWASIMSKSGGLWTNVQIRVKSPAKSREFTHLISLLDVQLDRAAGEPLDVVWESNQAAAFDPCLIDLLRRKGPFSQWRKLTMRLTAIHADDEHIFHPADAFSNLESLLIFPSIRSSIIRVLNRTTTSKLRDLVHHPARLPTQVRLSDCADIIGHIDCLQVRVSGTHCLPTNITQLHTLFEPSHLFPHLRTYNIQACVFASTSPIDLQRLQTLNAIALVILRTTEVLLPALRCLYCGTIYLERGTKICAPLLESVHISGKILGRLALIDSKWVENTGETIKTEGFPFSPSHSLTVELPLPFDSIVRLLEGCSQVESVSLGFDDEECAVQALQHIGGAASVAESAGVWICGRLRELRLTFLWDKCKVEGWKGLAAQVAKSRMGNGIVLRIHVMWKGEGAYVPLV